MSRELLLRVMMRHVRCGLNNTRTVWLYRRPSAECMRSIRSHLTNHLTYIPTSDNTYSCSVSFQLPYRYCHYV